MSVGTRVKYREGRKGLYCFGKVAVVGSGF